MLGLAMVAAAVAMAFVGATSASASTLCEKNEATCKTPIANGTEITSSLGAGKTAVLKGALGVEVICTASAVKGEVTENPGGGGGQVLGSITSVEWTNCTLGGNACTVTAIQTPYVAHGNAGTEGNGTMYVGPGASGLQPGATFGGNCGVLAGCTFKANETQPGHEGSNWAKLTVTGSETEPKLAASQVALKSSFFCGGNSGRWNADYILSSPKSAFLV